VSELHVSAGGCECVASLVAADLPPEQIMQVVARRMLRRTLSQYGNSTAGSD
jgi:hypothetical protein